MSQSLQNLHEVDVTVKGIQGYRHTFESVHTRRDSLAKRSASNLGLEIWFGIITTFAYL